MLTTDTVDIAAAAAAAAAVAEAAAAATVEAEERAAAEETGEADAEGVDAVAEAGVGAGEGVVVGVGAEGSVGAVGVEGGGGLGGDVGGGGGGGEGGAVTSSEVVGDGKGKGEEESRGGGGDGGSEGTTKASQEKVEGGGEKEGEEGPAGRKQGVGGGDGKDNKEPEKEEQERDGQQNEKEEEEEEGGEEFVPDARMRRGETACRKLTVESAAPLVRLSRVSPATSEALAGEETEEVSRACLMEGIRDGEGRGRGGAPGVVSCLSSARHSVLAYGWRRGVHGERTKGEGGGFLSSLLVFLVFPFERLPRSVMNMLVKNCYHTPTVASVCSPLTLCFRPAHGFPACFLGCFFQILELVNESGGPAIAVMEVWTRPARSSTSARLPLAALRSSSTTSLLFSLAATVKRNADNAKNNKSNNRGYFSGVGGSAIQGGQASVSHPVASWTLDVALAAPAELSSGQTGGISSGESVKLALQLRAGQAGDRDAITEV